MADKNWKRFERDVAKYFNTERNPLSGGNGKHTRSDTLHESLFVEDKYSAKSSLVTLFEDTNSKAIKEMKLPVICTKKKGQSGFLITVHSSDLKEFMEIVNEHKSKEAVHVSGVKNCDVLFIIEAPSEEDEMIGQPLVGKEGDLFTRMISNVRNDIGHFSYGITSVTSGISTNGDGKSRSITREEANICREDFLSIIHNANPKSICMLGTTAKKFARLPKHIRKLPNITLLHPKEIIAKGGVNTLQYKRNYLYLLGFLERNNVEKNKEEAFMDLA